MCTTVIEQHINVISHALFRMLVRMSVKKSGEFEAFEFRGTDRYLTK